jgi:hypothetical protein
MCAKGWRAFTLKIVSVAVLAGGLAAATPAVVSAAGCPGGPPPTPGSSSLAGVTATSSADTWAAGSHVNSTAKAQTLTEHWNGTAWKQVPSPSPGGSANPASLAGVAGTSATDVWAAGIYCNGSVFKTLTEHWNGTAWKQVTSPTPGSFPSVSGVAATSAANAWAVGNYYNPAKQETLTLIEHWNGTAWKQVPSPSPDTSPKGGPTLSGVAATSAANAWAVGNYYNPAKQETLTLIEHWNGTAWKQTASPNPGTVGLDNLYGVAATSASNAWAVGDYYNGSAYQTLVLHWNGTGWKQVASPNPAGSSLGNSLSAVTLTSATNAWAAGSYINSAGGSLTLILHWNGTAWKQTASPNLGPTFPGDNLSGVAATSASNAWAVGDYYNGSVDKTLVLHWNGTAWKHVTSP